MASGSITLSSSKAWKGRIDWTSTANTVANTSSVTATLYAWKTDGYNTSDTSNFSGTLTVAGSSVSISYSQENTTEASHATKTVTVTHNSSGTATCSISASIKGASGTSLSGYTLSGSSTVTLDTIDRNAPTITLTAAAAASYSISISASANASCDIWQYCVDSGSWTTFSTTSGTSASTTVSSLTEDSHTVQVRARKTSNHIYGSSSSSTVDLVKPTVTASYSNITTNSFKITASANVTCRYWWYGLDSNGWVAFSTTEGTSAEVTVTGLSPNTSYKISVAARKKSNGYDGYTDTQTITTLGGSVLHSATSFAADVAEPVLPINATVYSSFYHTVKICDQSDNQITVIQAGLLTAGTKTDYSISVPSDARTALLEHIPSSKSFSARIYLLTYSDSAYETQIGTSGPLTVTISTTEATSKPTFPGFTYEDQQSDVTEVTGDNQILVQNISDLIVHLQAGTAKNGASLSGYSLTIGDKSLSVSASASDVDVGGISSSGSLTLKVTCSDSRGYSQSVTASVKILPYAKPSFSSFTLRRRNEIDALVQLSFSGSVRSVQPSETEVNALTVCKFRWRQTSSDTWGEYTDLMDSLTLTGLAFSYENDELMELDDASSFYFQFLVEDEFGTLTELEYTVILAQGTPILAIRKRNSTYNFPRIGVNNPTPERPLDVTGAVGMNGFNVMGFVSALGDTEDLNTLTEPGIYTQHLDANTSDDNHYPQLNAGFLEVLANTSGYVLQRYTVYNCTGLYIRYKYNGTWGSWKSVSLS